jgi:spore coat polysaccharide biosynthesis predicted glycosyltransferase SpsG
MQHEIDILFRVDAGSDCGFGHAARCLMLMELMREQRPNIVTAFQGEYSPTARRRILSKMPGLSLYPVELAVFANLVVIDTMSNHLDMNAFNYGEALDYQSRDGKVLAICSGTEAPELPGMVVVGYQPSKVVPNPPMLRWSLDYAPVSPSLVDGELPVREQGRVLVALGGHPDDHFLRATLRSMKPVEWIDEIDILLSPVMGSRSSRYSAGKDKNITLHRDVPSVAPLLAGCELAIVSYGNMAFEALALGTPLCIVGQKGFQRELARRLDERCLAMAAEPTEKELPEVLEELRNEAHEISRRAQGAVDTQGLQRLADLILSERPSALSLLTS